MTTTTDEKWERWKQREAAAIDRAHREAARETLEALGPTTATIRTDPDTGVDELVMDCTSVHLEYMDEGCVWIGVYLGNERVCLFLNSDTPIVATVSEDDIGCEYEAAVLAASEGDE